MDPNRITYFAETDARNKKIRFGIKTIDRLRHTYVIGKTGVGKSTLLENMAIQDIQNGEGLAFIDPHGGTAEKLLDYIPENRIKDVLYFAPFDMEYPISFNVLEDIGIDKRHLVVNGLMSTFEKIWVDAWSARMAYILNNTLLALLEFPGATLLGVNRMLADKDYRKRVVDNVKDPSVKSFWIEEFGKYTERFAAEATPAIQNKVGQFTSNPLVRNLIGQPQSSFDIRKFMDDKKILIINLSKGLVGEGNAKLIGSMLITKIYLAAMSRADANEAALAKLPNFYLYVDEFQSFANKSFADILSEARKYKLSLNIAHQYIEQMEEEVRDAVFGNVGTMITFRVGALDAEVLEKEFAPTFTAEDLVNLGFAQVYLKLMIDGISSQPFSAMTMAPIPKPEVSYRQTVIETSRRQFARPRIDVEKEIIDWHGVSDAKPLPRSGGEERRDDRQDRFRPQESQSRSERKDFPRDNYSSPQAPSQSGSQFQSKSSSQYAGQSNRPVQPREEAPPAPDANKLAFMKATEMLQEKIQPGGEHVQRNSTPAPKTPPFQPAPASHPASYSEVRPISLSTLSNQHQDPKKIPSKENISSLKDALAGVLKKENGVLKPASTPSPRPQAPQPSPAPRSFESRSQNQVRQEPPQQPARPPQYEAPEQQAPIPPPQPASFEAPKTSLPEESPRAQREEKKEEKKETPPKAKAEFPPYQKEIPEDVLRQILRMEEK